MTIRERIEQMEHETLSPYATFDDKSIGRVKEEDQCDIRPVFQRDRDRILHCKSFRRLKNKTQVFLTPKGDHYRTRLSHTLEVSQNARTIAKALRLNEDLTEAIALGHDLGHTPFGHMGERVLNELCEEGFEHSVQSVRVVSVLEKDGQGLNLTREVLDGIRNHQISTMPSTPEGKVVRLADKIAYINHDVDDAIRGHIMCEEDIPLDIRKELGFTSVKRMDSLIHDVIMNSLDSPDIIMTDAKFQAMMDLRKFMFKEVYRNPVTIAEEVKTRRMITSLFEYYSDNTDRLPEKYYAMVEAGEKPHRVICDYISGMTDQYAISVFMNLFMPNSWQEEGL